MKLTFGLLLLTMLSFAVETLSQSAKINLQARESTIVEIFQRIEETSDVGFFFKNDQLDLAKKYTVNFKDESIEDVLNILLGKDYSYRYLGNTVVITLKDGQQTTAWQQQKTVTGKVTDSTGAPLPGVTVVVKGTTQGTVTDGNGSYSLSGVPVDGILVFSFVGMRTQEVPVAGKSNIDAVMAEDAIGVDEVVVIGFGERRKKDLTGSISAIQAEDLKKMNSISPQFALQGNTTGVRIVNSSGDPNEAPKIFVRGVGTWNGDAQPLYVIDGQIIEPPRASNQDQISGFGLATPPNLFNLINPNDIESMTVLKDASAAAIYGNRGANGVILITTKKGKQGKPTIEFNSQLSVRNIPKYKLLNTQQFIDLTEEMFANNLNPDIRIEDELYGNDQPDLVNRLVNRSPQFDPQSPFYISDRTTYNWQDENVVNNAFSQTYDVKVSGATENVDYYISASYLSQDDMFKGNDLTRYTGAMNINAKINKWLRAGLNYKYTYQNSVLSNGADLINTGQAPPWQPIYDAEDENGFAKVLAPLTYSTVWQRAKLYGQGTRQNYLAFEDINHSQFLIKRSLANGYFEILPIKGLTLRGSINLDYSNQDRFVLDVFSKNSYYRPDGNDPKTIAPNAPNSLGRLSHRINNIFNYQSDFTASYTRTFADKHNLSLTAAVQDQRHETEFVDLEGQNLISLSNNPLRNSYANDLANNSSIYGWGKRFWFGMVSRASYNYDSRYYLDLSLRRDASNGFDDDYRWGNFYSVSGAWRISSESFMKDIAFINDLKLRGGWGEAGNDQAAVGRYAFLSRVDGGLSSTRWGSGNGDPLGNLNLGALVADFPNKTLSWEVVTTTYAGFDALMFDSRLNFTFEWYIRSTDGILQNVNLPLSVATNSPLFNIGVLENRGIDLQLGWNDKLGNFTYNVTGNISFITNEVKELYNDQPLDTGFGRVEEGRSIGHLWGYKLGGIFQSQAEIDAYFAQYDDKTIANKAHVAPGDMYFLDVHGDPTEDEPFYSTTPDGIINDFDRTEIGNTIPGYTYGLNINLGWKNFDFFAGFYGEGDVDKYNTVRHTFESMQGAGSNYFATTLDRWTSQNTNTNLPRAVIGDPAGNNRYSSRYVESAAFFRLNNWQLGYSLPKSLLNRWQNSVGSLRVFIAGQNNIYLSKWSGVDPVNDAYPLPKTFSIGVSAKF